MDRDEYIGLIDEVIDETFEEDDYYYEQDSENGIEFPVTIEDRRAMGDDMLYPTYNIFGEWE